MKSNHYFLPHLILMSLLSLMIGCNEPAPIEEMPKPDFLVENDSCIVPCTVKFTNTTIGENATYSWYLHNGINVSSTDKDFQYTYTAAGNYDVELTATNKGGTTNAIKTINVRNKPTTCYISSISLISTNRLMDNGTGATWDNTGVSPSWYPDVMVHVVDELGAEDYISYNKNNISSIDLPWQFIEQGNSAPLMNLGNNRILKLIDVDVDPDMNDLMATFTFKPLDYQPEKPSYVNVTLSDANYNIVVKLHWLN